jgi:DNA-binding response OmpR family regulator
VKLLIADDDPLSLRMLEGLAAGWGFDVVTARDGLTACRLLEADDGPRLAVLDWVMPGMDGPDVCRKLREKPTQDPPYLILLTARDAKADIVQGLRGGANDYVTKPFDPDELQARIQVGRRVVQLQQGLAATIRQLQDALAQVKQLSGLLPICAWCKKVRGDRNYWEKVETYISSHSEVRFTHGICPECLEKQIKSTS